MGKQLLSAVIFDQDGTLVQSETMWPEIDAEYFTQLLGVSGWTRWQQKWLELKARGMPLEEIYGLLIDIFALDLNVLQIRTAREDVMLAHYRDRLTRCEGAETILRYFAEQKIPMAVASGMSIRILGSVREMMGWESFVSVLASTHETGKGKPDPSVYILAAQRLGVSPDQCLVFENEVNGFKAAVSAGMACRAVPDTEIRRKEFQTRRIPVFSSLSQALKAAQ